MSENLHDVDDLFRGALNDHEEEAPDRVWKNIDQELDKKRVVSIHKKYRRIKWVAAASIIFTCALATYTFYTRHENKDVVKEAKKANTRTGNTANGSPTVTDRKNEEISAKAEAPNDDRTYAADGKDAKASERKNSANGKNTSAAKQQVAEAHRFKSNIASRKTAERTSDVADRSATEIAEGSRTKKVKITGVQASDTGDKVTAEKVLANSNRPIQNLPLNKVQTEDKNLLPQSDSKAINESPATAREDLESLLARQDKTLSTTNDKPANNTIAETKPTPINPSYPQTGVSQTKNKSNKSSLAKLSATVFLSPDFISARVKNDKPRFREDDRNEIKRNEETKVSSSFGVLVDYNIGKNWSVLSGISYSSRITNITAKTIYARPDNRGGVRYRFNCSAGYTFVDVKAGNSPASGDSIRSLSATNTLHYLNIPIGFRYNIPLGKLSMQPSFALYTNFLTKGTIETVIATTSGNERTNAKDIEGLKPAYFNGAISIGAQYKITDVLALSFMPTARFALSSINKNAPVKTHFNSIGLATGLTIKL
jgi:hypothetical protein